MEVDSVPLLAVGGTASSGRRCRPRASVTHSAVDLLFVRRLVRLMRLMTPSVLSWEALLLAALVAAVCGNEALVYFVGMLPSQLIGGLVRRDAAVFFAVLWRAALYTTAEAVILSLISWGSGALALRWRARLVAAVHSRYLEGRSFYTVNQFHGAAVDNPDQRIVEDAALLCTTLATMFQSSSVIGVIVFYTQQVAALMGWIGPVTIYGYFILGSIVNKFLMSRVAEYVWRQEKVEGSFRFGHARLRSNCEQIALYRGGWHERAVLQSSFAAVLENGFVLLRRRFALDVSRNTFLYVGGLLSYVVVGVVLKFGGAFDSLDPAQLAAMLQQASFLSIMLISGFSTLVNLTSSTSDLAGYTARVAQLVEVLATLAKPNEEANEVEGSDVVRFENVQIETPSGMELVRNLSFEVLRGQSLLITGASGSGKSSIARVLHGLWPLHSGRIVKPGAAELCFIPQEPYLVTGTLADQITYPYVTATHPSQRLVSDSETEELLAVVRLEYLSTRFAVSGDVLDWATILSPGERQKIAFARLLYVRPVFAILDESTSAMSLEDEAFMYELLQKRGVSVISVGHRPSLRRFHSMHLALGKGGSWNLDK